MNIYNSVEQKRIRILSSEEIDTIYAIPSFTHEDRQNYFSISQSEKQLLQMFRSINSQVYLVLQLGYFKAKQLFFKFELQEISEDLQYILEQYFDKIEIGDLNQINRLTRLKIQNLILELFNYRYCGTKEREQLEAKASMAAAVYSKPIYIFREIMNYLYEYKIVLPGYSYIQKVVSKAFTNEQNRLTSILKNNLDPADIESLNQLLQDSNGLYEITQLKHEPKDFSLSEIKQEIYRCKQIQPLYHLIKKLLPKLGISNESIKYYASLVEYYSVYKLKRLNKWLVYVYLLCFVYYRYQRAHDNLINSLIYDVRNYVDAAKFMAKERIYESYIENNLNIKKVGQIIKIFTDDSISADTPFKDIQSKAFNILERQKLIRVANQIVSDTKLDETSFQWEHIDKLALQFKRHLRPILLMVDFGSLLKDDSLIEAVNFMKIAFTKNKQLAQYNSDTLPTQFISENIKHYIYKQNLDDKKTTLLINRYEFLVYRLLRNGLEAGDIFCHESIRFRSFEDDLLNEKQWQRKENLITSVGLVHINQPINNHLNELEQKLENRITEVNRRISSGENKHFQIKRRGLHSRWTLKYSRDTEFINHPFFDTLKQVEIGSVLHFTNQHCQFIEAFDHVLGRYANHISDDQILVACLIAWGTNMGLGRMGEISDVSYSLLSSTSDNFIRMETLKEANDCISNAISKLPIFKYYNIDKVIHSSSDGQKFETRINTINSRYSPKYFGLKKGIVNYTIVTNHIPVNARIIGANEHESHYVFDLLYNNTADIHSEVHSTDTHGTNEVNFAILHLFGYQFAPRFQDIYAKVSKSLYGFNNPSHYNDLLLKPVRKINTDLIVEEWDNIKRILVSLALKTTTQSIIIGKLSAYVRKNKTKRALWEYDNIIKSLYLLDYIDSLKLRQNVQKALNRGESYHKLRRAVSYANFGKLRFKTEHEQHIWSECSRLIANCIIYYNSSILSNMLTYKKDNDEATDMLKQISPISWQHINLYGRYEFNKNPQAIDMQAIISELAKLQVK